MRRIVPLTLALALMLPASAAAQTGTPLPGGADVNAPAKRDTEPVILKGSDLPAWSARSNQTARMPFVDFLSCQQFNDACDHNDYSKPDADTGATLGGGIATDLLLGYRYDTATKSWRQIPFQVDEMFTRYLNNSASGFAIYSGEDQHTTYAFDREGFRWFNSDPNDPCKAQPASPVAKDPVPGLDDNDELSFMYDDAGDQSPAGTELPKGIAGSYEIRVSDPRDATAPPKYVYVMQAAPGGPKPAYDATNGYVQYKRDSNADTFERSASSYSNYGNARKGVYCDKDGKVVIDPKTGKPAVDKRRPRDYATVKTDRYKFRYDGRWLMTGINISSDKGKTYGPDVVDRWKARAFAQDPGSDTPCCGFEEEDTNWGGSSTLLGEKVGPVRAIRETWGADSGTNVIRRETFYRYELRQKTYLRVHVIPPLDGIYAQWDFNAGVMKRFYNSSKLDGVNVDGQNDEVFGNLDDPCNDNWAKNQTSQADQTYRSIYQVLPLCSPAVHCDSNLDPLRSPSFQGINPVNSLCNRPYHQSIDVFDPTFSKANTALEWNEIAGPSGTIVDRIVTDVRDLTPGGAAQSVVATPYYRDDSCFDDGTGTDPGPKIHLRSGDEPKTSTDGQPRKCWTPADGAPGASDRFYQGSIGTHGLHLLFLADSDNARQTVPLDEIVSEWRMVMLPGDQTEGGRGPEAGQQYGDGFQQPVQEDTKPATQPGSNIVDRTPPTVKLKAKVHSIHHRIHLTYSVYDTGGSGIKWLRLQYKAGTRWKTLRTGVSRRRWNFKTPHSGTYSFRLMAQDKAGNVSKPVYVRAAITNRNRR
ncbi:MAG: hypothetical protein QOE06_1195 [Thermoleophilaceae bacterium]|nr:hypothetical protein [Thermoleophilaceae bacterium]